MSNDPRSATAPGPSVVARVAPGPANSVRRAIDVAIDAGASMVEVDLVTFEAQRGAVGVPCVVVVGSVAEAVRAKAAGAAALRTDAVGPERDRIAELATEHGIAVHVPFGRGAPTTACLDIGVLDADAGDDLVGRLAALADLAAAGRRVIATIGGVGPDDTAALATLAVGRGASFLRAQEVAAATRAARVVAALAAEHGARAR